MCLEIQHDEIKSQLYSPALLHFNFFSLVLQNILFTFEYLFPAFENALKSMCPSIHRTCLLGNEHNIPTWLNSSRYERLRFSYSLHHFFQFLGSSLWCHFRRLHYCIIGVIYSKLRKNGTTSTAKY